MTKFLRIVAFGIVIALGCPNTADTQDRKAAEEMKAALAAVKSLEKQSAGEMKKAQAAAAQDQKIAQEVNERALKLAQAELKKQDRERVPLRVQVVLSRYEGEKKTSSLPYLVSVNANTPCCAQLRMGARVPISAMSPPTVDGKVVSGMLTTTPITYEHIGTNIDCSATSTDDGRYQLNITIEDTSVYPDKGGVPLPPGTGPSPSFRSFRSSNTLMLRDGQTAQFAAAADRISGEVVKVDVTLTVVK